MSRRRKRPPTMPSPTPPPRKERPTTPSPTPPPRRERPTTRSPTPPPRKEQRTPPSPMPPPRRPPPRSEEHTSALQSLMRNSYDVFCLQKKKLKDTNNDT